MTTDAARMHDAVSAVCPIRGVSIGRVDDRSTWRLAFADDATREQKAAAENVIARYDMAAANETSDAARHDDAAKIASWAADIGLSKARTARLIALLG